LKAALRRPIFGTDVSKTKRGKKAKVMTIADRNSFPIALYKHIVGAYEIHRPENTLPGRIVKGSIRVEVADKAHHCDPLDTLLKKKERILIARIGQWETSRLHEKVGNYANTETARKLNGCLLE
jgi:hypothetical protein